MLMKLRMLGHYLRVRHLQRFPDRASLLAWQERQVRRFVARVAGASPFYSRWWKGLTAERWREFPVIDKSIMMAHLSALNTAGIDRDRAMELALRSEESRDFSPTLGEITVGLSSGTSGNRGLFLVSPAERARHAGTMLAKILPGSILARHRVAFFLRANSNLYTTSRSRRFRFEFFDLIRPLDEQLAALQAYDPTLLFAPPSVLRRLAEHQLAGRITLRPRKVVSIAEVLDPLDESWIARAFGQKVHQVYQCTEGFLGLTCAEGTLHLNEDVVAIEPEWIDEAAGKFHPIITDFRRWTQPIVRYRLNDILTVRRAPCPCGSPMLALESIEGRSDDVLTFPAAADGTRAVEVLPDFIRRAVMFASPDIEEYWVRQPAPGELIVSLKAPDPALPEAEARVREEFERLSERLGFARPGLTFSRELPAPGLRKLRRVERVR
jgi:putative adenylate-forming enzyme